MKSHYNKQQFIEALQSLGIQKGDTLFSHSNLGFFGIPEEGVDKETVFNIILDAIREVIGSEGTLVVPTFTYSFCKREVFDPANTPSTCGFFTEMLRTHPQALRSNEPIFSVAAIGKHAELLTENPPIECFGKNSLWERFMQLDGKICNLNFDSASTFIHYGERCINVPYRYDKLFTGYHQNGEQLKKGSAIFFCQDMSNPDTVAWFEKFDRRAKEQQLAKTAKVGRGSIVAISAKDTYDLIEKEIQQSPWFLTKAFSTGDTPTLIQPSPAEKQRIHLKADESMESIIEALWELPRDIISDGYNIALEALCDILPFKIHRYPTGTPAYTWLVPEKWTCMEASLETLDGKQIFSYNDHPLHCVSYSLPYEGIVSRDELFQHLHVHPKLEDAIPFIFKYYQQDWGLCCSQKLKDSLTDEKYHVSIKTKFEYGELKVGEYVLPGSTHQSIVLCAHLCHPHMVQDDLTGVAVGIEVMRQLAKMPDRKYTYRLLILPETIGSLCWLCHNEDLHVSIKGGLFLEMLGLNQPHALQLSYDGNTQIDKCFKLAVQELNDESYFDQFQKIIGNDERQFNSPGIRIPMLSLSRCLPRSHPDFPFLNYHSNFDNISALIPESLENSVCIVLKMLYFFDQNIVFKNLYKGEVFLSRYNLHVDYYQNPKMNAAIMNTLYMLDGSNTIADIAEQNGVSFSAVSDFANSLFNHGLVEKSHEYC